MAKRKKIKQNRLAYFVVSRIFAVLAVFALGVAGVFLMKSFLLKAKTFKVRKIYSNVMLQPQEYAYLKSFSGVNIFKINLDSIYRYFKRRHPEYKSIHIKRVYPDKLLLDIVKRTPFAQVVYSGNYFLIDEKGMVISLASKHPFPGVSILYASIKTMPKKGMVLKLDNFLEIKKLMQALKVSGFTNKFFVKSLYAYSLNDIGFQINSIRVKIGSGNYEYKLNILQNMLMVKFVKDLDKISYVDLRFKDPVIGYKK